MPIPSMTMNDDELRYALEDANLPTLQITLTHLTGDRRWLEEPFRPRRGRALDDNDDAGLPKARQRELRAAAFETLRRWRDGQVSPCTKPTGATIVDWLTAGMGEEVPTEEGPMMAEEAGFQPRDVQWTEGPPAGVANFRVLVIGAGLSGICASIKLAKLGIQHVVLEKNDKVGGTWLENDYPGAGVDTPSHLYSFSFAPNSNWSRYYAKQPEILNYLREVAKQENMLDKVRFGVEVVSATFQASTGVWEVVSRDATGYHTETADVVISSVGQLNRPLVPTIAGAETFTGAMFHSAQWRHDVDLEGKRVGVLGVGASAMQIVPTIAGIPAQLVVFQRSPQWVAPNQKYLREVPHGARLLMEQVPHYAAWYRLRMLWMFNDKLHASLQIDPAWPHPERAVSEANDKHRAFFTAYLKEQLAGRMDLIEKLLPEYPPYGKRILMDNNWFTTMKRDDVRLVIDPVTSIDGPVVNTANGDKYELDVLIYATGFQSRRMLYPINIRGKCGRSLREVWGEDNARAYLGMTVPGFPNFFMTYGPNTNLGHGGSIVFHTECQVRYITRMLVEMLERDIATVECRADVYDDYNARVDQAHNRMIWTHQGMDTWYRNTHGRVVTNTPWRLRDYWEMTHEPALAEFTALRRDSS